MLIQFVFEFASSEAFNKTVTWKFILNVLHPGLWQIRFGILRFLGFWDLGMLIKPNSVRQSALSRFWPAGVFLSQAKHVPGILELIYVISGLLEFNKTRNLAISWVHQFSARNV